MMMMNVKEKKHVKKKMDENVNDNLFVTKNLGKNIIEDIYLPESESNEESESNISKAYKYIKSFSNKQLNMIHNQKDLNQNRLMGNSYLFKNEFNLNKIRRIVSAIHRKKDEENHYFVHFPAFCRLDGLGSGEQSPAY